MKQCVKCGKKMYSIEEIIYHRCKPVEHKNIKSYENKSKN